MNSEILNFDNNEDIYKKIKEDNKITSKNITKYEYAKIIGIAAQQIESGRKPTLDLPAHLSNPIDIAEYELKNKKTPFIIKRKLPNDTFEYWTIDELNIN